MNYTKLYNIVWKYVPINSVAFHMATVFLFNICFLCEMLSLELSGMS